MTKKKLPPIPPVNEEPACEGCGDQPLRLRKYGVYIVCALCSRIIEGPAVDTFPVRE